MDENNEHKHILTELEETTPDFKFNTVFEKSKAKKNKIKKVFIYLFASLFTIIFAFIIIINLSTSIAYAVGRIPVLSDLARAAAFSPSLKAAIDNQYVQKVNITKEENGITIKVEYIIVDEKQANIFYYLSRDGKNNLMCDAQLPSEGNTFREGYMSSSYQPNTNDDLLKFTVDFIEDNVPDQLKVEFNVWERSYNTKNEQATTQFDELPAKAFEPEYIANFTIDLKFDPTLIQKGKTIDIKQWVELGKQRIYINNAEIYPTHIRLNLEDDQNNTAWLKGLDFSISDKNGEVVDTVKNGISGTGSENSPFMVSQRLESNYFSNEENFTISIDGATWLHKDHEFVKIDLKNKTYNYLPDGVQIDSIEKSNNNWTLRFLVKMYKPELMNAVFAMEYKDLDGNKYDINGISSLYNELEKDKFYLEFMLRNYPKDVVILQADYSYSEKFSPAKEININYR